VVLLLDQRHGLKHSSDLVVAVVPYLPIESCFHHCLLVRIAAVAAAVGGAGDIVAEFAAAGCVVAAADVVLVKVAVDAAAAAAAEESYCSDDHCCSLMMIHEEMEVAECSSCWRQGPGRTLHCYDSVADAVVVVVDAACVLGLVQRTAVRIVVDHYLVVDAGAAAQIASVVAAEAAAWIASVIAVEIAAEAAADSKT